MLYIIERREGIAKTRQISLEILPADEQTVFAAAHIKASHTLSYADAFAVAAAVQESAVVVTSDPEFEAVESLFTVEWLKE